MNRIIAGSICAVMTAFGTVAGAAVAELGRPEKETIVQVEEKVERYAAPKVVTVKELIEVDPAPAIILTQEEKQLAARVVQAEAGGEDMVGKRLVVDTILNRVRDPHFPDTVSAVVWQPCQYAVAGYYSDECMEAVEAELYGELDEWIVWFCNYSYLPYGAPAYQHGGHFFSWLPEKWIEEAECGQETF